MTFFSAVSVDVCIATYKRLDLIRQLLESLAVQTIIDSLKLRIIIIDNDPEKSAKTTVDTFFSDKDIAYIYDVQPEKNISLTRNKALDYATADYLAFIDDDEWASPDWLIHLLQTCQRYNADVIFGPVIPQFPEDTPDWIIKGGFFNRKANKTGDIMTHGATSNTLIKSPEKFKNTLRFDPKYGLTGGEDTDLFTRLHINGAKLVWCSEALVYEVVPKQRMTINWLAKRAFRGGQNYAQVHLKNLSLSKRIIWFIRRFCYLALAIALFPLSLLLGKAKWVWALRKIMTNVGQLSMFVTDNAYQEYK
jgi:succinoglycan biosynthesis protein ExoM